MTKLMPAFDVYNSFLAGKREFTDIECKGGDFVNRNLKGIIFRNCELSGIDFTGANLTGAFFLNCKLLWSSFDDANLKGARFDNSDLSWSKLNRAVLEKTGFRNANLTGCLLIGAIKGEGDYTGAILDKTAFSKSDLSIEGSLEAQKQLEKTSLPLDVFLGIKDGLSKLKDKILGVFGFGFGEKKESLSYGSSSINAQSESGYAVQESGYTARPGEYAGSAEYGGRRKKEEKRPGSFDL